MQLKDATPIVANTDADLLRYIHVLLAHEAEASEEYANLINTTQNTEVRLILEEIMKDEHNHMGRLLDCITLLCPHEAENIIKEE